MEADDDPIPPDLCDVYGLASSRDGVMRYVGQTMDVAEARHAEWLRGRQRRRGKVAEWIRAETTAGFAIELRVLIRGGRWNVDETNLIARYRALGAPLLNVHPGGSCRTEYFVRRPTAETRAKIGNALRGRRHSEEAKAKMRESQQRREAINWRDYHQATRRT